MQINLTCLFFSSHYNFILVIIRRIAIVFKDGKWDTRFSLNVFMKEKIITYCYLINQFNEIVPFKSVIYGHCACLLNIVTILNILEL